MIDAVRRQSSVITKIIKSYENPADRKNQFSRISDMLKLIIDRVSLDISYNTLNDK